MSLPPKPASPKSASPTTASPTTASLKAERWRSDAGATIVEMLVTAFLLSVGVMGAVTVLATSARTTAVADTQGDATALASSELEVLRSLDYDVVGIEPSASGYLPTFDGLPTVTESTNLVEPLGEVIVDGVTFRVERSATWATVGLDTQAYKVVTVVVDWESTAGPRSIVVQTGLHEGLVRG